MISVDSNDVRRISNQLDFFYTAFRCYFYFSIINTANLNGHQCQEFWRLQRYALFHSLVFNWCELFIPGTENNHWRELTIECPEYTKVFYESSGFNYVEWTQYRNYINEVKNSFLTFPDLYHHQEFTFDLHGIESSLRITQQWLNALLLNKKNKVNVKDLEKWPIKEQNYAEKLQEEVTRLFQNSC